MLRLAAGEVKSAWVYLLSLLGSDIRDWTMSPSFGSFELEEGGPPAYLRLGYLLFHDDPEISHYYAEEALPSLYRHGTREGCQKLAKESLRQLSSLSAPGINSEKVLASKPPVFSSMDHPPGDLPPAAAQCTTCHSSLGRAPHIPFDRPQELGLFLSTLNTSGESWMKRIQARVNSGTMPPQGPLQPADQRQLLNYLRKLQQNL
ncbi:MAG: hypothetical protein H7222_01945 [Methylotenera sp.]|nr:hypothetical protein [Oligoflexia bacterium]